MYFFGFDIGTRVLLERGGGPKGFSKGNSPFVEILYIALIRLSCSFALLGELLLFACPKKK